MLSSVKNKVSLVVNHRYHHQDVNWGDDFSGASELDALIEAKEQLAAIDFSIKKNLKDNVQLILNHDEAIFRRVQNVTHSYLTSLRNKDVLKKSIEVVTYEYLRQLYTAYTHILDEASLHHKELKLNTEKINLVVARYLNALFSMAKWRYFDDQPAPLGVWKNVHKIIRLAEGLSIMNKHLFLYDFQKKETSIATILERGFMLDTLQKGSYSQLEIELTDRVIRTWSSNPVISKEYTHDVYQFFIHLKGDKRPQRLRGAKNHPDFRYWKTVRMVDLIETYLCAVSTKKPLDQFNLTIKAATKDIVQLFKKLRVDWCVDGYKRQRRSEQRTNSLKRLDVSHGIEDICLRIKRVQAKPTTSGLKEGEFADDLTLANQNMLLAPFDGAFDGISSENWTMLEESSVGFSVELGKEISAWIKSGDLIGYSTMDSKGAVSIAEIKTVRKQANGNYRLGLLKISNNAIALNVSLGQKRIVFKLAEGSEVDDNEGNLSYSAGFLSLLIDEDAVNKPKLIVPRNMYKSAHHYKVNMQGKDHMLLAGDVVNNHHGWVCFEVTI